MRSLSFAVLFLYRRQTPIIHSHRCAGQPVETIRSMPMLTGAGLRLRPIGLGTAGLRTKGGFTHRPLRPPFPCLPSIRTTVLDAQLRLSPPFDYRPICAQFEDRLMSPRRLVSTLRAPSTGHPPCGSFISGKQHRRQTKAKRIPTRRKVRAKGESIVTKLSNSPHRKHNSINRPRSPASGRTYF
jgi:hypothetical protein